MFVLFSHGYKSLERIGFPEVGFREPLGILGVEIFFALSGFLITMKLLQEEMKNDFVSLTKFYVRRAFRILPAAVLFILSVSLLSDFGFVAAITPGRTLSTILFFANYSTAQPTYYLAHFWSLAVEEHFYFVWPAIFALCARKHRLGVAISCSLLIALWRAAAWKFQLGTDDSGKFFGRTDIEADSIMWGAALALAASSEQIRRVMSIKPIWLALAVFSGFAALFEASNWKVNFSLFSLCRMTVPLVIYGTVLRPFSLSGRVLDMPLIRFIGRISYSLYLWQQLFLIVPEDAMAGGPLELLQIFPLNLLAAFSCAIVSFYFVEQPLISKGRLLLVNLQARKTAVVSETVKLRSRQD
jgi:peptidoglycan/LPS O-acetylase OafA/YrhL